MENGERVKRGRKTRENDERSPECRMMARYTAQLFLGELLRMVRTQERRSSSKRRKDLLTDTTQLVDRRMPAGQIR